MQRNIKVIAKGVAHTCWTMQRSRVGWGGYWLIGWVLSVGCADKGWDDDDDDFILTCCSSWVIFCASIVAMMFKHIFVPRRVRN